MGNKGNGFLESLQDNFWNCESIIEIYVSLHQFINKKLQKFAGERRGKKENTL